MVIWSHIDVNAKNGDINRFFLFSIAQFWWSKDGIRLGSEGSSQSSSTSRILTMKQDRGSSKIESLKVKSLRESDFGSYQCHLLNNVTQIIQETSIQLSGKRGKTIIRYTMCAFHCYIERGMAWLQRRNSMQLHSDDLPEFYWCRWKCVFLLFGLLISHHWPSCTNLWMNDIFIGGKNQLKIPPSSPMNYLCYLRENLGKSTYFIPLG